MINKRRFNIRNTKKVLHKVGKQWVVVSAVLLGLVAGGGAVANANTTSPINYNQPHVENEYKANNKNSSSQSSKSTISSASTSSLNNKASSSASEQANSKNSSAVQIGQSTEKMVGNSQADDNNVDISRILAPNNLLNIVQNKVQSGANVSGAKSAYSNLLNTFSPSSLSHMSNNALPASDWVSYLSKAGNDINTIANNGKPNSLLSNVASTLSGINSKISSVSSFLDMVPPYKLGDLATRFDTPGGMAHRILTSGVSLFIIRIPGLNIPENKLDSIATGMHIINAVPNNTNLNSEYSNIFSDDNKLANETSAQQASTMADLAANAKNFASDAQSISGLPPQDSKFLADAKNNLSNTASSTKSIASSLSNSVNNSIASSAAQSADSSIATSYKNSVSASVNAANSAAASNAASSADTQIKNSINAKNVSIANSYAQSDNNSIANSYANSADNSIVNSYKNSISNSVNAKDTSLANLAAQSANNSIADSYRNLVQASVANSINNSIASSYANSADNSIAALVNNSVNAKNSSIASSAAKSADISIANSYKNSIKASVANSIANSKAKENNKPADNINNPVSPNASNDSKNDFIPSNSDVSSASSYTPVSSDNYTALAPSNNIAIIPKHNDNQKQVVKKGNNFHINTVNKSNAIATRGFIMYRRTRRGHYVKVANIRKGTKLTIKRVIKIGHRTKLQLTNGNIITANKHYVHLFKESAYIHALNLANRNVRHARGRYAKRHARKLVRNLIRAHKTEVHAVAKYVHHHSKRNRKIMMRTKRHANYAIHALLK